MKYFNKLVSLLFQEINENENSLSKRIFLRKICNCLSKLWILGELLLCIFCIYLLTTNLHWRRGIIGKINKTSELKFQIPSRIINNKVKLNVGLTVSRKMINHKLIDDVSHLYTCAKPNSYIWRSLLTPVIWFQSQLLIWLSWIFRSFWL